MKIRKKDCTEKFIVVIDTLCGNACAVNENDKPEPNLYDNELDAYEEIFSDAFSMLTNRTARDRREVNVSPARWRQMCEIEVNGTKKQKRDFLDKYPESNYNNEFVESALTVRIEGKHIWQF